jgi:hypothetical protein
MSTHQYKSLKVADHQLIAKMQQIATIAGLQGPHLRAEWGGGGPAGILDSIPINQISENQAFKVIIEPSNQLSILRDVRLNFANGETVRLNRSEFVDSITIDYPDQSDAVGFVKLIRAVQTAFPEFAQPATVASLGPEFANFYAHREQALARLEDLSHKLIEQNEQYRRNVDLELSRTKSALQQSHEQRETELHTEYESKSRLLEEKAAALEARTKELDDRSSKHARRQTRMDLKRIIATRAEKFALTPDTRQKRYPIHAIFIALLAVSAFVLG